MATLLDRLPSYVPAGYVLRETHAGAGNARTMFPGFGREAQQTVLVYTSASDPAGWDGRLTVSIARPGAGPLVATSPKHGRLHDLGLAGVNATYHDGVMVAGTDANQRFTGPLWLTGTVHSITARSATGTFAVRGPSALSGDELARVIMSLHPES